MQHLSPQLLWRRQRGRPRAEIVPVPPDQPFHLYGRAGLLALAAEAATAAREIARRVGVVPGTGTAPASSGPDQSSEGQRVTPERPQPAVTPPPRAGGN